MKEGYLGVVLNWLFLCNGLLFVDDLLVYVFECCVSWVCIVYDSREGIVIGGGNI